MRRADSVHRLESAGYIERRSSPSDRRGTEVILTQTGVDELRRTAPVHMRGIVTHFTDRFQAEELERIADLFDRLVQSEPPGE